MSTILDALRKAQRKTDGPNDDAPQAEPVSHPEQPEPTETPESFDDPRPAGSLLATRPAGPSAATIGLAFVGLVVGVAAAQVWLGNWSVPFLGSGDRAADVAPPAPPKKSALAAAKGPKTRGTVPSVDHDKAKHGHEGRSGAKHATEEGAPVESASSPTGSDVAPSNGPKAEQAAGAQGELAAAQPVPEAGTAPRVPQPAGEPDATAPGGIPPARVPRALGGRVFPPGTPPAEAPSPVTGIPSVLPGGPPGPQPSMVLGNARPPLPAGGPSPPAPSEAPQAQVLQTPPTGAPEVSLLFIQYSRDTARRVASLRGPGAKLMLVHEGDKVEGMEVATIRPDSIELDWNGTKFLLLADR